MRFLNNLTIKNFKINKKRTISLIIGIILAIFLITSVITIISSFQKTLLEHTKKTKGDYHYGFLNVPAFELDEFSKDENIDKIFVTKILGYSSLQESSGTNIPLEILSFSQGSLDNLGLEITDGRIPQTDSEIIFSDTLTKYNETDIKLGSQIELELQNGDNSYKKTYTIVGMVNITDEYIETVNNPNSDKYIAITKLNEYSESDKLNVYIKIKDLDKRLETIAKLQGIDDNTYKNLIGSNSAITEKNLSRYENNKYVYLYNNTLLGMQTGDYIDETAKMVYSVAGIIILVIVLTSVYCIRNSFDISITEKIKQYGIVSSIGATKKQIRKIVFHEAFILGIISIPIFLATGASAFLIVSDEFMDKYYIQENQPCFLHIQAEDDIELEKYIKENYSDSYWAMGNNAESRREQQSIITGVSIFLYGFIIITALIGTTNIFNTITTSMELRQREFMHLKSIGMTKKEFNKMIRLETIFLGGKSLIIGIILGLILSYLIYLGFSLNVELNYIFPIEAIIISIIAVSILIGGIMKYSLNKINKLNIIETIRNENI